MDRSSGSYIGQSIYQSQTRSINMSMRPVQQPQNQAPPLASRPDDKTFLKYYEENLQLKNHNKELMESNRDLKDKLTKKDQNKAVLMQDELRELAKGKKSAWDTKHPKGSSARGLSGRKGVGTSNKVEHLMEIIEHYKAKLLNAEEEISNLRRQKMVLQQDVRLKDKRVEALRDEQQEGMSAKEEVNLHEKLRRNIREVELQKQRAKFLELAVRDLEKKLKYSQSKVEEFEQIKGRNRHLEEQLRKMTQITGFRDVLEKGEEQRKAKELQRQLKLLKEKYNTVKDGQMKQDAQVKLLNNQLIQTEYNVASLEKENQQLRKQSINDPIIVRLSQDPQLVQDIIVEIDTRRRSQNNRGSHLDREASQMNSKIRAQKLILEKEALARQLLESQEKLSRLEESYRERERLSKLERQEAMVAIAQSKGTTTSKQGVLYDGDTSMFSEQTASIRSGTNFFDLFLGQVSLMQTMLVSVTGLANPSSPLLLATVDFYSHNTQHSKLTQGYRCDLQSQFSFKVTEDDFFLRKIEKDNFQVDLWASEGNKNHHIGRATVDLKYIALKSRPRVSPVIATSVPLYLGQKVMGSINMVFRLRMPIHDQLQKLHSVGSSLAAVENKTGTARKLVMQINEGHGFGEKGNTFVYFSFRLEDYYTRTSRGNNPVWDYIKKAEITYDDEFKNYLRKAEIELTVFDDSVVVVDDRNSDVVGSGTLSLLPLLQGKDIKERLEIRKGNQRKGTIDVKIYWHEADQKEKEQVAAEEERKMGVFGVHEEIGHYMREYDVDAEKVYRQIDNNRSGMISYDEFANWVKNISSRKFSTEVINSYYKGFKQPLNLNNFIDRLIRPAQLEPEPAAVGEGLGQINEMLKLNSTQMKKQTLEEFLVNKRTIDVGRALHKDTDRRGFISKAKLEEYFQANNIECEVEQEKLNLMNFLNEKKRGGAGR